MLDGQVCSRFLAWRQSGLDIQKGRRGREAGRSEEKYEKKDGWDRSRGQQAWQWDSNTRWQGSTPWTEKSEGPWQILKADAVNARVQQTHSQFDEASREAKHDRPVHKRTWWDVDPDWTAEIEYRQGKQEGSWVAVEWTTLMKNPRTNPIIAPLLSRHKIPPTGTDRLLRTGTDRLLRTWNGSARATKDGGVPKSWVPLSGSLVRQPRQVAPYVEYTQVKQEGSWVEEEGTRWGEAAEPGAKWALTQPHAS